MGPSPGPSGGAPEPGAPLRDGEGEEEARADAREIIEAARRGSGLVDHRVAFGQGRRSERATVDLDHLVPEVEAILRRPLPSTAQFQVESRDRPLPVPLTAGAMEQVVMKLVQNARDTVGPGGCIRVEAHPANDRDLRRHPRSDNPEPTRGAVLRVVDGGRGMTPEVVDRVFEPFFTTRKPGEGTGLGLSTVHGNVEEAGGWIDVYREPGRGTAVAAFLPLAAPSAAGPDPIDTPTREAS